MREIAAVLACGESAVLSHRSAAVAWGLLAQIEGDVDVIVPERCDRSRDAELLAAGYRILRVTWRQLVERPKAVVARIAEALAAGRA